MNVLARAGGARERHRRTALDSVIVGPTSPARPVMKLSTPFGMPA